MLDRYSIDKNKIALLVWSKGTISVLELLQQFDLPITHIGLISPVFPSDINVMQQVLLRIKDSYPQLKWFIRHGLDDSDSPIYTTRKWVELLQQFKLSCDYEEIPHSSHWNYLCDPEESFYNWLDNQDSGETI